MTRIILLKISSWIGEKLPIWKLLLMFLAAIFLFGMLYWYLTPSEHGILESNQLPNDFSFFDGLYFSVVTASSLGYGDFRPIGLSRILAVVEVIFGLIFIGLLIASSTSQKITSIVSRSWASAIYSRLEEFTHSIYELKSQTRFQNIQLDEILNDENDRSDDSDLLNEIREGFPRYLADLYRRIRNLFEYLHTDSKESLFFELVTEGNLESLIYSINDLSMELETLAEKYRIAALKNELMKLHSIIK